jgi:hemerythrin-like domain-containing protein
VIERILLIYEEAARRIEQQQRVDLGLIARTAHIVQEFVEEYHEQIEERYVFPRLRKANREVNLVGVLLRQHERGRRLTDEILQSASSFAITTLPQALHSYSRMYRPHAAREDTVVFPAFRKLLGRDAYRELGEEFESEEHTRFGEHGFDRVVTDLSQIEAALNISELAAFTPL